jgi:adenylyl-sulfate kinase
MTGPVVSPNVVWHESDVPRAERWKAARVHGATVWFTGLSGSGKSTIASALAVDLTRRRVLSYTLDGDNLRHGLNGDLGFSAEDRSENVRRVGEVARLFADAGVVALVPLISPYRAGRDHARALHDAAGLVFLEVFDDPYEPPREPQLVLPGGAITVPDAVDAIVELLAGRGVVTT